MEGVILFHLQAGPQRFGELRKRLPGITQRMLTKQLCAPEEDNLVIRKVYAEVPPRGRRPLSEIGERLRPVIDALKAWDEVIGTGFPGVPRPKIKGQDRAADPPLLVSASPSLRSRLGFTSLDLFFRIVCMTSIRCLRCCCFPCRRRAGIGAGSFCAVVGGRVAGVLCADRAPGAAGGRERLRRQDRADPQPVARRSDFSPLLRRPGNAA